MQHEFSLFNLHCIKCGCTSGEVDDAIVAAECLGNLQMATFRTVKQLRDELNILIKDGRGENCFSLLEHLYDEYSIEADDKGSGIIFVEGHYTSHN